MGSSEHSQSNELRHLLSPMIPEEFVQSYFGKRPLFVGGTEKKFAGLFREESFYPTLERVSPPGSSFRLRAHFNPDGKNKKKLFFSDVAVERARAAFEAGASVCVNAISDKDPKLARYAANIKAQLGYPGSVRFNCYYSPPGAGLDLHFDARITASLQISGRKRWVYSKQPSLEWPRDNASLGGYEHTRPRAAWEALKPPDPAELLEVDLRPGDLLVLPAGTWHSARASRAGSLALNLAFEPFPLARVVFDRLRTQLEDSPEWRAMPASLALGDGEADPEAHSYLKARLAEMRAVLDRLERDDLSLRSAWLAHSMNQLPEPVAAVSSKKRSIRRSDVVRVSPSLPVRVVFGRSDQGSPRAEIYYGARRIRVDGAFASVAAAIARRRRLTAGDVCRWPSATHLSWSKIQQLLGNLLDEGVLARE